MSESMLIAEEIAERLRVHLDGLGLDRGLRSPAATLGRDRLGLGDAHLCPLPLDG